MDQSSPVIPVTMPYWGHTRRGTSTLKDVLHADSVSNLRGQHALNDAVRDEGQQVLREVVENRFQTERGFCATQREVLENRADNVRLHCTTDEKVLVSRFEVEKSLKDFERSTADRFCQLERALMKEHSDAAVRREVLAKEALLAAEKCCCETQRAIAADGEKTRDFLQKAETERLRDRIAELQSRLAHNVPV